MISFSKYLGTFKVAYLSRGKLRPTPDKELDDDKTDYNASFRVKMARIRAASTQISPSIIEGTFIENHAHWEMKSEREKRRIQLMIMAKDVVEWLVCEPIGSNEKLVSKMEHDVLAYFAEAQKNGATDRDILVTWNYVSTCLAGIFGREFQIKTVDEIS